MDEGSRAAETTLWDRLAAFIKNLQHMREPNHAADLTPAHSAAGYPQQPDPPVHLAPDRADRLGIMVADSLTKLGEMRNQAVVSSIWSDAERLKAEGNRYATDVLKPGVESLRTVAPDHAILKTYAPDLADLATRPDRVGWGFTPASERMQNVAAAPAQDWQRAALAAVEAGRETERVEAAVSLSSLRRTELPHLNLDSLVHRLPPSDQRPDPMASRGNEASQLVEPARLPVHDAVERTNPRPVGEPVRLSQSDYDRFSADYARLTGDRVVRQEQFGMHFELADTMTTVYRPWPDLAARAIDIARDRGEDTKHLEPFTHPRGVQLEANGPELQRMSLQDLSNRSVQLDALHYEGKNGAGHALGMDHVEFARTYVAPDVRTIAAIGNSGDTPLHHQYRAVAGYYENRMGSYVMDHEGVNPPDPVVRQAHVVSGIADQLSRNRVCADFADRPADTAREQAEIREHAAKHLAPAVEQLRQIAPDHDALRIHAAEIAKLPAPDRQR